MHVIDLRSDTLTQPTEAMRQAMAAAEVGDDVFGEDPTVIQLEHRVAGLLGKEAALFVTSGTMSNQLAVRTHCQPGDEVILDENAHIYYYEAGAFAALSGVVCRCLKGELGVFSQSQLLDALRPPNIHFPPTRLVCLENTHNRGGGTIWPLDAIRTLAETAHERGLHMHLDGARLWNAAAASGIPEHVYAGYFDSISVCFSKGLGAPVGSALLGTHEFIERARRFRKQFGGGMRQAGIIAAGALHALDNHRDRLAEDHVHARILADALTTMKGVDLNPKSVQTNIVLFKLRHHDATTVERQLSERGIKVLALGPTAIRAVTHLNISRADIITAAETMHSLLN